MAMERDEIEAFVTIQRVGGFTRAATILYMILDQHLGYVLLHSIVAGKTGIDIEKKQNIKRCK